MLSRIADRMILFPSRDSIDPEGRTRKLIATQNGQIEAWIFKTKPDRTDPDLIAIKFPGTGGRAERGGPHPFEQWDDLSVDLWAINHTGYGGSEGVATVKSLAASCDAVWEHVRQAHPQLPVILIGNSLGCVSALYLAARTDAAGIFLRNPVPLHQLISNRPRYNWWNFGMAKLIARQVPMELDAVANAQQSTCPAFFVRSAVDRVVPTKYQQLVFDNYAGDKVIFELKGADHDHPVPEADVGDYLEAVGKMRTKWKVES